MDHAAESGSPRPRTHRLTGPLVRVAAHTAGPAIVLYLVAVLVPLRASGTPWWRATGLALVTALVVTVVAVLGFRSVAARCSRCGNWTERTDDGTGQELCPQCWQIIAGPPTAPDNR